VNGLKLDVYYVNFILSIGCRPDNVGAERKIHRIGLQLNDKKEKLGSHALHD